MKKWGKFLAVLLICGLLLSGCSEKKLQKTVVVTGARVILCHEGQTLERVYHSPEKLHRLLYYLRKGQTKGYARVNPERILGDCSRIELQLSDGGKRVYLQRADRYLSVDLGRWKNIDESWGRRLYGMVLLIPSDPVANSAGG